jgi:Domain of unknown function (DUF4326)
MSTQARRTSEGVPARWAPTDITQLDPQPVQQLRGKHLPAQAVSVARPSRWGNPYRAGRDQESRAVAVVKYAVWLAGQLDLLTAARNELAATWPAIARLTGCRATVTCFSTLPTRRPTRSPPGAARWA